MSGVKLLPMPTVTPDESQREAARATYAMYRSYVEAGFDKHQAMQIVLELLRTSLATPQPPKRPG